MRGDQWSRKRDEHQDQDDRGTYDYFVITTGFFSQDLKLPQVHIYKTPSGFILGSM
jgi:hypothetical protein